jgi:hypothetical protein
MRGLRRAALLVASLSLLVALVGASLRAPRRVYAALGCAVRGVSLRRRSGSAACTDCGCVTPQAARSPLARRSWQTGTRAQPWARGMQPLWTLALTDTRMTGARQRSLLPQSCQRARRVTRTRRARRRRHAQRHGSLTRRRMRARGSLILGISANDEAGVLAEVEAEARSHALTLGVCRADCRADG